MKKYFLVLGVLVSFALTAQVDIMDSGGPLMPEQASYDVSFYDLELSVDPAQKYIEGKVLVVAEVVQPLDVMVLDLDTLLAVTSVLEVHLQESEVARNFSRRGGKIYIPLGNTRQVGAEIRIQVAYEGHPRVAPRAPWDGGFTWAKTPAGADWIATTCQTNGADLWWPCKDHVSDEPDSMALHITVPQPLVVASNGRLNRVEQQADATVTYHWDITNPINIYNVALNIAPYRAIEDNFSSISGEEFPFVFYVLPEDYEKGLRLFPELKEHLAFFEKLLGPYPFRSDKYGVAQTPHLGMEHQTIIAYGANFSNTSMTRGKDWGFDALHHHELAHEWWGNLVTNFDWRDMWIHEGFGTYMQALYMEELKGMEGYHDYMNNQRRFSNQLAIAPLATQSAKEIYRAPIYSKGAWVLHSLRYLLGDEVFFEVLRRMCYPDPAMENVTDGSQTRFVSTADFQTLCEQYGRQPLGWFFDNYLRRPEVPTLYTKIEDGVLSMKWESDLDGTFAMPIEVEMEPGKITRHIIPKGGLKLSFEEGIQPVIDPNHWVLLEKGGTF